MSRQSQEGEAFQTIRQPWRDRLMLRQKCRSLWLGPQFAGKKVLFQGPDHVQIVVGSLSFETIPGAQEPGQFGSTQSGSVDRQG